MEKKLLLLLFSIVSGITAQPTFWQWNNWQPIKQFPKGFLFGAGISHYQYEGSRPDHIDTDYNNFDLLCDSYDSEGKLHKNITDLRGNACKGWDNALNDVDLVYDAGLDVYRISVSWEKINPYLNVFDHTALAHYQAVLDRCNERGIKVLVGLHHYTDPVWFTELGGWTKRENIQYFVQFARKVYKALGDRVWLWSTFNSPSGYAAKCFLTQEMIAAIDKNNHPVMKKNDFSGFSQMLCNLCLAHVEVYHALKQEFIVQHKAGACTHNPQIGILKNILQFEPEYVWDKALCHFLTNLFDNAIFEFFTKGTYPNWITGTIATDTRAPLSLDFIGLNYYSHKLIHNFKPSSIDGEVPTQNPNYVIYPEGLYYALATIDEKLAQPLSIIHSKSLPIYVTENGIAAINDEDRETFFKKYLYALHKAIDHGINVKGYITWSLMDNYEWGSYSKKYGLYHVDFNHDDRTRTLKTDAGTQYFLEVAQKTRCA